MSKPISRAETDKVQSVAELGIQRLASMARSLEARAMFDPDVGEGTLERTRQWSRSLQRAQQAAKELPSVVAGRKGKAGS